MKLFKGILGLFEMALLITGVVSFWNFNRSWAVTTLIYVVLCILIAVYEVGRENGNKNE